MAKTASAKKTAAAPAKKPLKLPSWDLTDFYASPNDPAVARDMKAVQEQSERFAAAHRGKVALLTPEGLAEAIVQYEKIQERMGRLGSYAQLMFAGDMNAPGVAPFYQNVHERITLASSELLFFALELNMLDEAIIRRHLEHAAVARYAP